jgi:hypothetical protein
MKPSMTLKTGIVLITSALICLPQLATAQGNLVENGGFDTSADNWTLTGTISYYNVKNGNPPGEVVFWGLGGAASQTINGLTPGFVYTVSGDYLNIGLGGTSTNYSFGVSIDGIFLFETAAPADFSWYSFNFEYTATSSSALLSLSQIDANPYAIDNISMEGVPEPSVFGLLVLGGIFFGLRRRC